MMSVREQLNMSSESAPIRYVFLRRVGEIQGCVARHHAAAAPVAQSVSAPYLYACGRCGGRGFEPLLEQNAFCRIRIFS